jgi:hypothetical protein
MSRDDQRQKALRGTRRIDPPAILYKHAGAALRRTFSGFNWRRDMIFPGLPLAVITTLYQAWKGLSILDDWENHRLDLLISFIVGIVGVIALDAAWRILRAFYAVYRERDIDFKETVQAIGAICIGALIFAAVIWYGKYETTPHFTLDILDGVYRDGNAWPPTSIIIAIRREGMQPNTTVTFPRVRVNNSGTPSEAKNWRLVIDINGEPVTGQPDTRRAVFSSRSHGQQTINPRDLVFLKTAMIKNEEVGSAVFYFPGVSNDLVRQPTTKLILSCEDNTGKRYTVTKKVPVVELAD